MAKVGRLTKLTAEVQEKIVQAIRAGNYAEIAAGYAGIGTTTFYRWMQQGWEQASGRCREFREAVKAAEREAEVRAVAIVQQHMPSKWQAAMTYLERKFPERWSRREKLEHSGPEGGPVEVEHSMVPVDRGSVETRRQIIAELKAIEASELPGEVDRTGDGS